MMETERNKTSMSNLDGSSQQFNLLLDKRFLNAFVREIIENFKAMALIEAQLQKPQIEKSRRAKGDVAGVVGLNFQNAEGNMTLSFEKQVLLTLVSNMFGDVFEDINDEALDAVEELTHIIYSSAKAIMTDLGYSVEILTPMVICGDFTVAQYSKGTTLSIPFQISNGNFYVEITC